MVLAWPNPLMEMLDIIHENPQDDLPQTKVEVETPHHDEVRAVLNDRVFSIYERSRFPVKAESEVIYRIKSLNETRPRGRLLLDLDSLHPSIFWS